MWQIEVALHPQDLEKRENSIDRVTGLFEEAVDFG